MPTHLEIELFTHRRQALALPFYDLAAYINGRTQTRTVDDLKKALADGDFALSAGQAMLIPGARYQVVNISCYYDHRPPAVRVTSHRATSPTV
jgi:hypothetical protein